MMYEVEEQLGGIMLDLLNLNSYPGQNMQAFQTLNNHELRKIGKVTLKGQTPPFPGWKDYRKINQMIDATISYIDKRGKVTTFLAKQTVECIDYIQQKVSFLGMESEALNDVCKDSMYSGDEKVAELFNEEIRSRFLDRKGFSLYKIYQKEFCSVPNKMLHTLSEPSNVKQKGTVEGQQRSKDKRTYQREFKEFSREYSLSDCRVGNDSDDISEEELTSGVHSLHSTFNNKFTPEIDSEALNDVCIDSLYSVDEKVGELFNEEINPDFLTEEDFDIRSIKKNYVLHVL
ncbi:unnamed protein product [Mytilus coruscus]|uniref:Uncharacterized protein n=1 Tax=Mytilus coruscus TaxID=42192 RepID=A0A6J8AVI0_MYTCO|nr:unnamed protein product [Mytilus coruscus]